MTDYAFDVFLSYAHDDRTFARRMVQWLRRCGLRVWIDEEQLVPGSRFRAGLQQGLQESRHMVALLTEVYSTRPWTDRELDVFDKDADHSERRILGIEIGAMGTDPRDQVFQVHQRIRWSNPGFDPQAFWKLHCGLTNTRPGARENWADNGKKLIEPRGRQRHPENANKRLFLESLRRHSTHTDLGALVYHLLKCDDDRWIASFTTLQALIGALPFEQTVQELISFAWSIGLSESAAVISMAALPKKHLSFSPWPFLDLSCSDIVAWLLMKDTLKATGTSEIWFSWAISQQAWDALPNAAARAPNDMAEHFTGLAKPAVSADVSFETFERDYNYGIMITPWNHFHLAWLAARLGDMNASRAHATALCSTTKLGDVRTGRFLNRLTTWSVFSSVREDPSIHAEICDARQVLGMIKIDDIPAVQRRLTDIWHHVLQGHS